MQLGRVVSFVPCTKKKRSLECYNKLYLLTASVFVHRDSVLTLARCFPRFKRDYSSFIIFFLSLSRNISLLVSSFKPVSKMIEITEIDEILRFISDFFFFISSKGKRKRIGLKFERMRGHRSGKIIFPGWKLYRFALWNV